MIDFQNRLWSKVEFIPFHECYEWNGHLRMGYGRFKIGSKYHTATRVVWELEYGPIPNGLNIRHKCDNPSCVRIEHLELGTQADNVNDTVTRGHHKQKSQTHCAKGHEFTDDNTYRSKYQRHCRTCQRKAVKDYRERKR